MLKPASSFGQQSNMTSFGAMPGGSLRSAILSKMSLNVCMNRTKQEESEGDSSAARDGQERRNSQSRSGSGGGHEMVAATGPVLQRQMVVQGPIRAGKVRPVPQRCRQSGMPRSRDRPGL